MLGAGNVGSGVARILLEKSEIYAQQLGCPIELAGVLVRDTKKRRENIGEIEPNGLITDDAGFASEADVDIVVEVIGGEQPALGMIKSALEAGKYVVTANKEVMAKHGPQLLSLARDNDVDLLFEASVGGGIPIISPLQRDLMANRILSLTAIVNGTTNYVLTAMSQDGSDYESALRRAQELGYAEANPANDVEGEDARYKLAILATLAFRTVVRPEDIHREGITRLTANDFRYAAELGYAIKLLALARLDEAGIQARVHPALLPMGAPLAKVDGVLNAVQLEGDLIGRVHFQGRGAGSFPTTSALIADILDAAQSIIGGRRHVEAAVTEPRNVTPMSELITRYYIRLTVADRPGVLAQIAAVLGNAAISIASVLQKETDADAGTAELVIMTHEAREESMQRALAAVAKLDAVPEIGNFVRVEEQ